MTGKWKDTGLAELFLQVSNKPQKGKQVYIDFEHYAPSDGAPASFIGTAIFDDKSNYIGVLGFQMPIHPLDIVMQVTAGMGKTGETYLVGSDLLMRSNSRFFQDNSILKMKVDRWAVQQALLGESGVDIIQDYRGIPVFSAYAPIDFFSSKWIMIAEIDESEVMKPVYAMSHFLLISGLLLTVAIAFIGYVLAYDIAHPIVAMTDTMDKLAQDNLDTNISVNTRQDEVGSMAEALIIFKQNAIEKKSLHQQLSHIANHDVLTGLPSRKFAMEQLDSLLSQAHANHSRLAMMFIDLDEFKLINDTFGHDAGDNVLKKIAEIFRVTVREGDIVARLGGDEFIVISPNVTDIGTIKQVASNILDAVRNRVVPDANQQISASIGITVFPDVAQDGVSLLKQADKAMYIAKHAGKNQYHYLEQA